MTTSGTHSSFRLAYVEFALLSTCQGHSRLLRHPVRCIQLPHHNRVGSLVFEIGEDILGCVTQESRSRCCGMVLVAGNNKIVGFCALVNVPELREFGFPVRTGCGVRLFDGSLGFQGRGHQSVISAYWGRQLIIWLRVQTAIFTLPKGALNVNGGFKSVLRDLRVTRGINSQEFFTKVLYRRWAIEFVAITGECQQGLVIDCDVGVFECLGARLE